MIYLHFFERLCHWHPFFVLLSVRLVLRSKSVNIIAWSRFYYVLRDPPKRTATFAYEYFFLLLFYNLLPLSLSSQARLAWLYDLFKHKSSVSNVPLVIFVDQFSWRSSNREISIRLTCNKLIEKFFSLIIKLRFFRLLCKIIVLSFTLQK